MTAAELRALCVDYLAARELDASATDIATSREVTRLGLAIGSALGTPRTVPPVAHVTAILAALDDAERVATERLLREMLADTEDDLRLVRDEGHCAASALQDTAKWLRVRLQRESAKGGE